MTELSMEQMFSKTIGEAFKLVESPFWVADDFCHYTNLHGLKGIIEQNEIWLSDHRFLNDPSEYSYGKDLACNIINSKISENKGNDFSKFLEGVLQKLINKSLSGVYLASMSRSPDRLDQWKGYGNHSESVCIVFKGDFILWNQGNSHPTHIQQNKIIYSEDEQIKLIGNFIEIYKRVFFEGMNRFVYPFINDLASVIEMQLIYFKHSEYMSENEIRLTISNLNHILKVKSPRHRILNGMVIPYISTKYISLDKEPALLPLPLKEIIVSPLSSQDTIIKSIEIFLNNMGHTDVPVRPSNIRFRG